MLLAARIPGPSMSMAASIPDHVADEAIGVPNPGHVRAAGQVFSLRDYSDNPAKFSQVLQDARATIGYATWLCAATSPRLVVRHLPGFGGGGRFILAAWPFRGADHDSAC